MAKITPKASIYFEVPIVLAESEARALDALVGYGTDKFIIVFYQELGASYMQKHEAGLRELFLRIGEQVRPALGEIDKARDTLSAKMLELKR